MADYTPSSDFTLADTGYAPAAAFDFGGESIGGVALALAQNVAALGSASLALAQTVTAVGNATLGLNQSVADAGIAHCWLEQKVGESSAAVLGLQQSVQYPVGAASLGLAQSVAGNGQVLLALAQNVYDPDFVAAGWTGWDIAVTVAGADVGDALVDSVSIEAERSSARIAQFTMAMSGSISPAQWVGKDVAIDYIQSNGAAWRRFTGVVERAEYDIFAKTLRCLCTDDLQKVADGHSRAQLDALVGGYWSAAVFDEGNRGWDYLQDLLKTVFKSVELDSNRQLSVNGMNNKAAADYAFDASLILDESLAVALAQRNQLVNRVDISFQARYSRLHHLRRSFFWQFPKSFCAQASRPPVYPEQSIVRTAIENAGWTFLSANVTPLWPTGLYTCSGNLVAFTNVFPDGMRGFSASAAKRWGQTVTDSFELSVVAPASVEAHGELPQTIAASLNGSPTIEDWGGEGDDYSSIPAGFVDDGSGHYRYDDVDDAEIAAALAAVLNEAAASILRSHQQNAVTFRLPLAPYIELGQTVAVGDSDIDCNGVVHRFAETYDFNAGTPVTEIRLAISTGGSGLDVADVALSPPNRPQPTAGGSGSFGNSTVLDTHLGGYSDSPPENENWTGMLLNADTPEAGSFTYNTGLKLPFAAIDAADTDSLDPITPLTYRIAVPDNLLTITA